MKDERAGSPASVRFKFAWSTRIDECDGTDEDCPMKDPRTKWEEAVPDGELQIYYNMGMIQYFSYYNIWLYFMLPGYKLFCPLCNTYCYF